MLLHKSEGHNIIPAVVTWCNRSWWFLLLFHMLPLLLQYGSRHIFGCFTEPDQYFSKRINQYYWSLITSCCKLLTLTYKCSHQGINIKKIFRLQYDNNGKKSQPVLPPRAIVLRLNRVNATKKIKISRPLIWVSGKELYWLELPWFSLNLELVTGTTSLKHCCKIHRMW